MEVLFFGITALETTHARQIEELEIQVRSRKIGRLVLFAGRYIGGSRALSAQTTKTACLRLQHVVFVHHK